MSLDNFSDEELINELKERKKQKEEAEKPKLIENPDFTDLKNNCQEYIDCIINNTITEDQKQFIFEAAMSCCFGNDIWDWIMKKT